MTRQHPHPSRLLGLVTAVATASVGLSLTPGAAHAATPVSVSVSCGDAPATFTVPARVSVLTVKVVGAAGGSVTGGTNVGYGGRGGTIEGTVPVSEGDVITVNAGCKGSDSDNGGTSSGGGGAGAIAGGRGGNGSNGPVSTSGAGGAGGGGASAVTSSTAGTLALAGGGGGGGGTGVSNTLGDAPANGGDGGTPPAKGSDGNGGGNGNGGSGGGGGTITGGNGSQAGGGGGGGGGGSPSGNGGTGGGSGGGSGGGGGGGASALVAGASVTQSVGSRGANGAVQVGYTQAEVTKTALSVVREVTGSLTFTAKVTADSGVVSSSGPVDFTVDGTALGSAPLVNGTATLTTDAVPDGVHRIRATFPGDTDYAGSYDEILVGPHLAPGVKDVDFGTVRPGASSEPRSVTLRSDGINALTISQIGVTSTGANRNPEDFTVLGQDCTGHSLAVGAFCTVSLGFSPGADERGAIGTDTATLSVVSDSTDGEQPIDLSGAVATLGLDPRSVAFGDRLRGSSTTAPITVTNGFTDPFTLTSAVTSGASSFSIVSDTCAGATLAPAASCTTTVAFRPAAAGSQSGLLTVRGATGPAAAEEVVTAALGGTGITERPAVTGVSPASGSTAGGDTVTVSGSGFVPGATTVALDGSPADYVSVDPTGTSLTARVPAHDAATVDLVVSTPSGSSGTSAADQYSYVVVVPPGLRAQPASHAFGDHLLGTDATTAFTITNDGAATPITSLARSGAGSFSISSDTCAGSTLETGDSCTFTVRFLPTAGGPQGGAVTLARPGSQGPLTVSFGGTGLVRIPTVTAVSPASGPASGGQVITVTGTDLVPGSTTVTFSGTPADQVVVAPDGASLTVRVPSRAPGLADVRATTPSGVSPNTTADDYELLGPPVVVTTTSVARTTSVVGQPVRWVATVAPASAGGTVQFSVDGAPLGVPQPVVGGTAQSLAVSTLAAGSHTVRAAFSGADPSTPSDGSADALVTAAATATEVRTVPGAVVVSVVVVAPGAGAPRSPAEITLDGLPIGTVSPDAAGHASLATAIPAGSHTWTATFLGDGSFLRSSATSSKVDPVITALRSGTVNRRGWSRKAVTVTYACAPGSAPLAEACPAPVTVHSGKVPSLTRAVTASDGGTAQVTVTGINVDTGPPRVGVKGVRNGTTYVGTVPHPRCAARDGVSGLLSCRLVTRRVGNVVSYRVTATDRAGNVKSIRGRYRLG